MSETLENLLNETRQFPPPAELTAQANVKEDVYQAAEADRIGFWDAQARRLSWAKEWDQVLDWSNPPFAKWFVGGQLNVAYNCLDRHVEAGRGSKAAIYWEGEPGDTRCLTYADLHTLVCQAANTLTDLGVRAGDRVAIYMPMIPELAVAMLACARIGATHNVVFGGFSVEALAGRITDAEHPLFILYTSGTTAKPKGILHTTGGYLTQVSWTHHAVFDLKPDTDVFWCTADIGWVTGHSYIVYGPLSNGATELMYEGTPDTPHRGRFWELIEKYKVSILYTAPTAIRTFMKWGDDIPAQFDLSSLRLIGTVGEPINPEAWMWYREHIGDNRCPIVDTWWQTETGSILISPLPGVTATKPGSAMTPLPGVVADVVDDQGSSVPEGGGGFLVIREPWPAMLRTIWGDDQRYIDTYWSRFGAGARSGEDWTYFPGDGAKRDNDGHIWLLGRVDDVMLVSGHNISTTEVESALVSHPKVAEAAVVGATDPTTGQGIVAFTILRGGVPEDEATGDALAKELRDHVAHTLGPIAKPRQILVVAELPKTRSGKIMRRLLRDVAENRSLGDVTTLQDSSVMDLIASGLKAGKSDED